ncbi:amidohydrolase [Shouchella lonarensis]|uniref:5-methylthioadenosine/S-adenosylhomocysteine deaminase n=1 Tax=Shouchella lonarensis TaxID=1464122 RepID=A0A1G6HAK3_9BACI|nr:amidohydrolase [Shouchella lonarensis]SDB91183.1 5-methylthioadenosine/S-adenosylhomocysteine deaminase [Shouchella lonarensis]
MKTVVKNVTIITMNPTFEVIKHGYVVVEKGVFTEVSHGDPHDSLCDTADLVENGRGKWLMPGLINTHGHPAMSLLRGISDDAILGDWLKRDIWPLEGRFLETTTEAARNLSMIEMIESGTTTFLDMYHLHMPQFAEVIASVGMRATLMRSVIGLCADAEREQKLLEALAFAKTWHQQANGRIQTMLAPHAPYTCPPAYIEQIVAAARAVHLPVHMHVAETRQEVANFKETYAVHPIDLLNEKGLLDNVNWLFAHCVHVEPHHIDLLSQKKIAVSHNPKSNLKLGSGIAPVAQMLACGVTVGLGTDSAASNNALDLFEEMRFSVLLPRGISEQANIVKTKHGLQMATIFGAQALRYDNLGAIAVGMEADFILLDCDRPHLHPTEPVTSHLVFAAKGSDVTDVYVQGKPLMKDRTLLTLDKERILAEANTQLALLKK